VLSLYESATKCCKGRTLSACLPFDCNAPIKGSPGRAQMLNLPGFIEARDVCAVRTVELVCAVLRHSRHRGEPFILFPVAFVILGTTVNRR
jgi:hypothetical protein